MCATPSPTAARVPPEPVETPGTASYEPTHIASSHPTQTTDPQPIHTVSHHALAPATRSQPVTFSDTALCSSLLGGCEANQGRHTQGHEAWI